MKKQKSLLVKIAEQHRLYIMMLPMLAAVTLFCYIPLGGWAMAFTDYQLGGSMFGGEFIGFKQFTYFFTQAVDPSYVSRNTLVINLDVYKRQLLRYGYRRRYSGIKAGRQILF